MLTEILPRRPIQVWNLINSETIRECTIERTKLVLMKKRCKIQIEPNPLKIQRQISTYLVGSKSCKQNCSWGLFRIDIIQLLQFSAVDQ